MAGALFEDVYLDRVVVLSVLADLRCVTAETTWNTCLGHFQRLSKWLFDPADAECPALWRNIHKIGIDWEEKLKDKWLSEAEVYRMLDVCDVVRDRAIIGFYLSGLRAREGLSAKIRDVEVYGSGFKVLVTGKTGTRPVYLTLFAPLLRQWLNLHPLKHNPSASLWINRQGGKFVPLGYWGLRGIIIKYARLAGINRPVRPHWLRHTRVTWTAQNTKVRVSNEVANKMYGWAKGSHMYGHYTHITGADVADAFLGLEGAKEVTVKRDLPSILEPRKCLNCNEVNDVDASYCAKCGWVLNEKEADKKQLESKAIALLLKILEKDPDYIKKLDEDKP